MTELKPKVKKKNCNEINDLGALTAKSLIYKGIRKTVILRFLSFLEPLQLGGISCAPLMDLNPVFGLLEFEREGVTAQI